MADVAVAHGAGLGEAPLGGDAGALHLFAGRDLGLFEGLTAGDLEMFELAFPLDPRLVHLLLDRDALPFEIGLGEDIDPARLGLGLGNLHGLAGEGDRVLAFGDGDRRAPRDVERLLVAGAVDALRFEGEFEGDLLPLDLLAGLELRLLDGRTAGDLALGDLLLAEDAGFRECLLLGDADLLRRPGRGDAGFLGLKFERCALAGQLGPLEGAAQLDLALLVEPGIFVFAIDLEHTAVGFEVLGADLDHRLLFDEVAGLAPLLDRLRQLGQTLGVEGVRGIEEFEPRLIDVDEGDVLEFEPVHGERVAREFVDAGHEGDALLVDLFERHLRRRGAQRPANLPSKRSRMPSGWSARRRASGPRSRRPPGPARRGGRIPR